MTTHTTYLPLIHTSEQSLADKFWRHGILFGTCIWPTLDAAHMQLLGDNFSCVYPENALKMGEVWTTPDTLDWSDMDSTAAIARSLGQTFIGAPLVWAYQNPVWLYTATPAVVSQSMRSYIRAGIERYPWMRFINVVNEALELDGHVRQDSPFFQAEGAGYFTAAFQQARDVCAEYGVKARLFYNDFFISEASKETFFRLHQAGLVDGFGFQAHWDDYNDTGFPDTTFDDLALFAEELDAAGADLLITEMDVAYHDLDEPTRSENQAAIYAEMASLCIASPACRLFGVWGLVDNYSWHKEYTPLVFDRDMRAKPAYYAIAEVLEAK